MYRTLLTIGAGLTLVLSAAAQDCTKTSTGLTPLTDLGTTKYKTFDGGLYGNGSNTIPAAHLAAGLAAAGSVAPLDAQGNASPSGRIVVISIGMSNTTQEFSTWVRMSDSDPNRAAPVRVVDCAQGGQDARKISDPNAQYWSVCDQRIQRAGLTGAQVQVAWIKQAIARPTAPFPKSAQELQGFLVKIAQILKAKYPNLQLVYASTRIYAGYATTALNPEPFAYESGFSVKWLIDQQMKGDPELNFDPRKGAVKSAWLAWGPYLWADGLKGRKIDSLKWECRDFRSDGTHPSPSGAQKVADLLDGHFKNHVTTKSWYVGKSGGGRAAVLFYGTGCDGSRGALGLRNNGVPALGTEMALGITNAKPAAPAAFFFGGAKGDVRLDASCTFLIDPLQLLGVLPGATTSNGTMIVRLRVPNDSNLTGKSLFGQFLVLDAGAPGLRFFGGGALSRGAELRIGTGS